MKFQMNLVLEASFQLVSGPDLRQLQFSPVHWPKSLDTYTKRNYINQDIALCGQRRMLSKEILSCYLYLLRLT